MAQWPPIFVISLARSTQRRADVAQRLRALHAPFVFVDGVDGKLLNMQDFDEGGGGGGGAWLNQQKAARLARRPLTPGEIGCYLSHYLLWRRIAEQSEDCALVLEDDAVFADDFAEVVAQLVASDWHWGIINLATGRPAKICRCLQTVGNKRKFGLASNAPVCASAYLIRPFAAGKLLSYCQEVREAIDCLYVRWWRHGAPFYYVSPSPSWQSGSDSFIGDDRTIEPPRHVLLPSLHRKRERLARFMALPFHCPQKRKI